MLSNSPVNMHSVSAEDVNKEALRLGIAAELDAVSLYEQLATTVSDPHIRDVFLDIAKEEKTHVGEFQAMLLKIDREQAEELVKGKEEVEGLIK